MKLDRNENPDGRGKYALVRLRGLTSDDAKHLLALSNSGCVDFGAPNKIDEFFVIKLRDKYAQAALRGYSYAAYADDPEWAGEVSELAARSGPGSKFGKQPD